MKPFKFISLISLVLICFCVQIVFPESTGKIIGTVVDSEKKAPVPARVLIEGTVMGTFVDPISGSYEITNVPPGSYNLIAECIGYQKMTVKEVIVQADSATTVNFELVSEAIDVKDIVVMAARPKIDKYEVSTVARISSSEIKNLPISNVDKIIKTQTGVAGQGVPSSNFLAGFASGEFNTENYDRIYENEFKDALNDPLSTFSIDVDAASYSNIRRFLNSGSLPPEDAVRVEEMINYFTYDYPQPNGDLPFSITAEVSVCPWEKSHRLVHIGLQGKTIETEDMPPGNLVFLLDVSGSMQPPNKLPLLKSSFMLLVEKLREQDNVAIVVYAGNSRLHLPSTPGNDRKTIIDAIEILEAGGCTAGGQGIITAYEIAKSNFKKNGNNRVILATDGDFNIGISSDAELVRLIEEKRKEGIFLSVLGFGVGNLKDSRMEKLADKGNGNYAYIDNLLEAKKVFVNEMGSTLFTIAKDVKIQIEFNPAKVKAYRLVGYENRLLNKEDFDDDTKDAGELGSGHTVTALYEIIPHDSRSELTKREMSKYLETRIKADAYASPELMSIKLRYKKPDGDKSKLIEYEIIDQNYELSKTSDNFRFSAAVAEFGMLLRDSKFKGDVTYDDVIALAKGARGEDQYGYRAEFIEMVELAQSFQKMVAEH